MKNTLPLWFSAAAVLIGASAASAQYPGAPPQVSPYVNLGRTGPPAINYYGIIRPQQRLQGEIVQTQQALIDDQRLFLSQEALANQPVVTGNYAGFMTQGRYFMTRGNPGVQRPGGFPGAALSQPAAGLTGRPSVRTFP